MCVHVYTGRHICIYTCYSNQQFLLKILFSIGEKASKRSFPSRDKSKNNPNLEVLCPGFNDHWHYANSSIPEIPKFLMGETLLHGKNWINIIKDNRLVESMGQW